MLIHVLVSNKYTEKIFLACKRLIIKNPNGCNYQQNKHYKLSLKLNSCPQDKTALTPPCKTGIFVCIKYPFST